MDAFAIIVILCARDAAVYTGGEMQCAATMTDTCDAEVYAQGIWLVRTSLVLLLAVVMGRVELPPSPQISKIVQGEPVQEAKVVQEVPPPAPDVPPVKIPSAPPVKPISTGFPLRRRIATRPQRTAKPLSGVSLRPRANKAKGRWEGAVRAGVQPPRKSVPTITPPNIARGFATP